MHRSIKKPLFVGILTLYSVSAYSITSTSVSNPSSQSKIEALTKNQALIFENIYGTIPARRDVKRSDWQAVKTKIKEKASMDLNQHVRIGLDRIKTKSLDQKGEIVALDSHVAPRNGGSHRSKGYGVTFKITFD